MVIFFESIMNYLQNYIMRYSYFITGEYYLELFAKYFSVTGFIFGFIFVLLVYFSSAEEQSKAGFFKVLMLIAVINSCTVIFIFLNSNIGNADYQYVPGLLGITDNIVSGFVLTLVVVSCYKDFGGRAFLLGLVTFAALPMINFSYVIYYGVEAILQMIIRIVAAGFLCLIISFRKYFYTSWIWYFGYHILMRTVVFLTPMFLRLIHSGTLNSSGYSVSTTLRYYSSFKLDYIVFFAILFFAIIFERAIIPVKMEKSTA